MKKMMIKEVMNGDAGAQRKTMCVFVQLVPKQVFGGDDLDELDVSDVVNKLE